MEKFNRPETVMAEKPIFKTPQSQQIIVDVYDKIVQNWPFPYQELDVETGLGKTHVIACGERTNKPLILLHGSSSNACMWIGDVATYSQNFRVYAIDIPGEPGKSNAVRPLLKSDSYALWMDEVLVRLGTPRASLVGISLGGWLALKYAIAFPERIEKLVLLCPSGVAPQRVSFFFQVIALLPFGKLGRNRLMRIINGNDDIPEAAVEYTRLIGDNFNPRVESIPLFDDPMLKRLTMPTYLLVGEKDALLPSAKTAARLKSLLPDVKVEIFPAAGHVLIGLQEKINAFLIE
jgi:pimeloyl-ACP methyl ester carboxylesterase